MAIPGLLPIRRPDENHPRARRWFPWLVACLAFVPLVLLRVGDLAEADTFWQIRTGEFILAHGSIPIVDPFPGSASGLPWRMNSWGFDVVVALAHRAAGLPGVALLGGAMAMAVAGVALLGAKRLGAPAFVAGALLVITAPLLVEWLTARPQLADYLAVPALLLVLRSAARGGGTLPGLLGIAAISAVWGNLHAAATLGIAIVGAATVLVAVRRTTRARLPWFLAATVATVAGVLANPFGPSVFVQGFAVRSSATALTEWQPLNPLDPIQVLSAVLGLLALVAAVRRREAEYAAGLVVLLAASVLAVRFLPLLLLVALPVLASLGTHPVVVQYLERRRVLLARAAAVGVGAFALVAAPNLLHIGQPDPGRFSTAVVGATPRACPLFNSYDLGGFVLLERPDLAVSIDSRAELYGAAAVHRYADVADGRVDPGPALAGVRCVLMPPSAPLVSRLRADPSWRVVRADRAAVLLVRD